MSSSGWSLTHLVKHVTQHVVYALPTGSCGAQVKYFRKLLVLPLCSCNTVFLNKQWLALSTPFHYFQRISTFQNAAKTSGKPSQQEMVARLVRLTRTSEEKTTVSFGRNVNEIDSLARVKNTLRTTGYASACYPSCIHQHQAAAQSQPLITIYAPVHVVIAPRQCACLNSHD